jgi:hypothetical protein
LDCNKRSMGPLGLECCAGGNRFMQALFDGSPESGKFFGVPT